MKYVWLCGASEKVSFEDSNSWRKSCVMWLEGCSATLRAWNPNDYYNYGEHRHKSDTEIFRFCSNKVDEASVILVNLKDIRLSVGSIMELAWARFIRKPVIGFLEDEFYDDAVDENVRNITLKNLLHPWVYECCDRIETGATAMMSALDYIEEYYG